jgi:glycosyltransferase involved in cell wall biosynthesis
VRIAYVTETWHPSVDGVVTRLQSTLDCLTQLGHQTLVIAPAPPHRTTSSGRADATASGGPDGSVDRVVRVPSISLPFLAGGRPFGSPVSGRVRSAVADFGADIVHVVNPFWMARTGINAARVLGLPLVASFHQDLAMVAQHMHLSLLAKIIWGYTRRRHADADITLATSQAMLDLLADHNIGHRLALWPWGVDTDRFTPNRRSPDVGRRLADADTDRIIAVYAGRLAPEKGLHRLYPLAHDPGISLVIAGDGPQRPVLERHLAGGCVRYTGWLTGDELADVYANADVFVFPSTTETLGFGLIEALAAGLPAVAADSAPTREVLGDSNAGTIVPVAGWDTAAVRAARWIGGPGRSAASEAARRQALQWDWMSATQTLVETYRSLPMQSSNSIV